MKYKAGSITSVELAKLCGVSQGTVDRALNDKPGINPKTKEHILKVAGEHGYIKNMRASSLVLGKSKLIGLVVFNLKNEFFSEFATAVEQAARQCGYSVMIALSNTNITQEKECIERMFSFGADGVILCPVGFGNEYVELISRYKKPIVTVANKAGDDMIFIGVDEFSAMAGITTSAIQKKYENIYFYAPPLKYSGESNLYAQKMRFEGYRTTMENHKREGKIFTEEDSVMQHLKVIGRKSTAILCTNDYYALRLYHRCKLDGILIPNDIGLSGFDNINTLELFEQRLTTVAYPISDIGNACVTEVVKQINGESASNRLFECKIIQGQTL